MIQPIVRIHHLLLSEVAGTVTERFYASSKSLAGFYLDYALACADDYKRISLYFSAGPRPDHVKVERKNHEMAAWSPSIDTELARDLIRRHLGGEEVTQDALISVVERTLGDTVELFRVVAATQGL